MLIGITGKSGVGKTTAIQYLQSLGAYVIDADLLTHTLYEKDSAVLQSLVRAFGERILNEDGTLNRKELGKLAFASPASTEKLNAITHPAILSAIREKAKGHPIVMVDGATLIESGFYKECDRLIAIVSTESKQRIIKRDGLAENEAELRLSAQKEDGFYTRHADTVIENNKTVDDFLKQLDAFWQEIIH